MRSCAIDLLHMLYLGVMNNFCAYIVLLILEAGLWGRAGTWEETVEASLTIMKTRLEAFYRRRRRSGKTLTQINDFILAMVGDKSLKLKGAECYGFFLYLCDEMRLFPDLPNQRNLLEAASSMSRVIDIWDSQPWKLSQNALRESVLGWSRFLTLTSDIAALETPKRHMSMHLIKDLPFSGNPRFFANWKDESWNKTLKACCRQLSQHSFEVTLLCSMRGLLAEDDSEPL